MLKLLGKPPALRSKVDYLPEKATPHANACVGGLAGHFSFVFFV